MTAPSAAAPLAMETVTATLRHTVDQVSYDSTLLRNILCRVYTLIPERVYRLVWRFLFFISFEFIVNIVSPLCHDYAFWSLFESLFLVPLE